MKLDVLDVFCGAGGFSEGFRQQGFLISMGIDNWQPAIKTFNHNFGLKCEVRNVLDYYDSIDLINALPNTAVIIGSPPCVSFSNSNRSGKADKSKGVLLTKAFLRIVAVKKYRRNSTLKCWLMENVVNSMFHLKSSYTFRNLKLTKWAIENGYDPDQSAIVLKDHQSKVNAADFGSPQIRSRVISGEWLETGLPIIPQATHKSPDNKGNLPNHRSLKSIRDKMPSPFSAKANYPVQDALYPQIRIKRSELADHFYDSGLYASVWKQSHYLKCNHPYMGRMAFPENEGKPSRTVTATTIGTAREALIYESEKKRHGNGQYRIPTVRESACLMGFPITYQFLGSHGTKQRLIGNAVCPCVSAAYAKQIRRLLGLRGLRKPNIQLDVNLTGVTNLSDYKVTKFTNPPKKRKSSRFRRHPFKDGNITVTLSNYDIQGPKKKAGKWITSIQYGNGDGYPFYKIRNGRFKTIEKFISQFKKGQVFLEIINNGFTEKIGSAKELQRMHEEQESNGNLLEPSLLIDEVVKIIRKLRVKTMFYDQSATVIFKDKVKVPFGQILALHAINKISTLANTQ